MTDTWIDLATHLQAGDEVIFTQPLEYGAHGAIARGTTATVVENGLNEMACMLVVKPHGDAGEVYIPGPGGVAGAQAWAEAAVVSQLMIDAT